MPFINIFCLFSKKSHKCHCFLEQTLECESFLESNSHNILALYETNLIIFFYSKRSLLIIFTVFQFMWRNSSLWDSFCMGLISRKICGFLLMFWTGFTPFSILLLFPLLIIFVLYWSSSSSYNAISSNIDELLSINPSAVFLFGDFNIHHKNWPSYYGGDLVNFVITFLSQMALLRWLTFLLRSLTVTLTVLLLWISFFLLMLVFVLKWLFHHWEILIMLLCKFLLTF